MLQRLQEGARGKQTALYRALGGWQGVSWAPKRGDGAGRARNQQEPTGRRGHLGTLTPRGIQSRQV